jgi:pre-mRNA-splicing factor 38A
MANVTDPLIRSLQGTDPQNLLEYITRQKIYDSRYWKEDCFGLTVVDVLEKGATSLTCVGGTMGANQRPTKFLCLTLKLLQLQPETDTILQDFIRQDHFKYVRVLGCFYLRLTGRPAHIYQALEPLYGDHRKLKLRERQDWKLTFMDQVVHELLTLPFFVGITLPRLPARATLQQEGYLDEGTRLSLLDTKILQAGGLTDFLRHKAFVEKSPAALLLWEERVGNCSQEISYSKKKPEFGEERQVEILGATRSTTDQKRKVVDEITTTGIKLKNKKDRGYGTLFSVKGSKGDDVSDVGGIPAQVKDGGERSEEYWNQQRAQLGLKPLNNK